MTCVLGMVVRREREIREFVKTPFYRVVGVFEGLEAEWKAVPGSKYYIEGPTAAPTSDAPEKKEDEAAKEAAAALHLSPLLYKENGFLRREDAEKLIDELKQVDPYEGIVKQIRRKKETKNPPMLYNLAELQNDCSKRFKSFMRKS